MENNLNLFPQLYRRSKIVVVHRGRGQRIEINACSSKGETSAFLGHPFDTAILNLSRNV